MQIKQLVMGEERQCDSCVAYAINNTKRKQKGSELTKLRLRGVECLAP